MDKKKMQTWEKLNYYIQMMGKRVVHECTNFPECYLEFELELFCVSH